MESGPDCPEVTDLLQVKGGMPWIGLEKGEVLVGCLADVGRKAVIQRPVAGGREVGEVAQRGVHFPASKSDRALSIRFRNGPDF